MSQDEKNIEIKTELQNINNKTVHMSNPLDKNGGVLIMDSQKNGTENKEDTPLKIDHDEIDKEDEEIIDFQGADDEMKKKLIFEQKNVSVIKLYCHFSERYDVLLMILGLIGSLGSGVAFPIIAYLAGDMTTKMPGIQRDNSEASLSDEEIGQMLQVMEGPFMEMVDDMVNKFLYIGTGMFFAYFLMTSMWTYTGLRQMHKFN